MRAVPLLADFAVRLAFGLIASLMLTSWMMVPPRFFRIQSQVSLGVLVLAGLAQWRGSRRSPALGWVVAGALLVYLAAVSWGLGLPRVAIAAELLAALVTAAWLTDATSSAHPGLWALNALSRSASGFLLGATLTAMLLGHHYL